MEPATDDERAREPAREAFIAAMRSRIEQAQASGQSPEQIRKQTATYAREEVQRQIPQLVSRARSWWSGFRLFLIVGALAVGLAIGLAMVVEHRYAAPLCEQYAARHGLAYRGFDYPVTGGSSSTKSTSGSCLFVDSAGHRKTVSLSKLEPNGVISLLAGFALLIEFTIPVAFILVALLVVALGKFRRS